MDTRNLKEPLLLRVQQTCQPISFKKGDLDLKFILDSPSFTAPQSIRLKMRGIFSNMSGKSAKHVTMS